MLNRAPIFVIGFPRGGTTLLMNILGSHPDVAVLGRETHQVFYGRDTDGATKWLRRAAYAPIAAGARQHVFRMSRLDERHALPRPVARYADLLFFWDKLSAPGNRDREDGSTRSRRAVAGARLLAKNMTGLAFATPVLRRMYPDATFIALVRDGLAVCEGWTRRRYTAERAGRVYDAVVRRMLDDAARMDSYIVVSFEELLADPETFIQRVYAHAGLDPRQVRRFKFWIRESMDRDGTRGVTLGTKHAYAWLTIEEMRAFLRADVNPNQIARLRPEDRDVFLRHARESMQRLGYLPAPDRDLLTV